MYEQNKLSATEYCGAGQNQAREQRPHERAVQICHEMLHKLDAIISEAEVTLRPVTLPVPPMPAVDKGGVVGGCGAATSEVVTAVDGLAERINSLTGRLSGLIGRVQV